jgi:RHS repeat-associated protein
MSRGRMAGRPPVVGLVLLAVCGQVACKGHDDRSPSAHDRSPSGSEMARVSQALTSIPVVTNASNFNGTAIAAGRFLWFSSVMKVTGVGSQPVHLYFNRSQLQFTAGSTTFTLPVPSSKVTIDPAATLATTQFNAATQTWEILLPATFSGNALLGGFGWQVPTNLPGGINPVTWSASFESDANVSVNWQWAAAVYTSFTADYNALHVKPVDDNTHSNFPNSDPAGTPEAFKSFVIGGARGGGGSNFTGSLSGTVAVSPVQPCAGVTCPLPDQCHLAGTCDVPTGTCTNPAKVDGTGCSDGNGCTQTDTCQSGACVSGQPVTCNTPPNCQVASVCAPATGLCSAPGQCNQAPTVAASASPNPVPFGAQTTLTADAHDDGLPSGSSLAYTWITVSGPGAATIADAHAASTTASFASPGTYVLRVSVTDSQLSATADVTVLAQPPVDPTISIAGVTIDEGQSGTSDATVTLALSFAADHPVQVSYQTEDGAAVQGCDYLAGTAVVSFAPGEVQRTIRVPIIGDTVAEPDEDFRVRLGGPVGATLAVETATVVIRNDDVANLPPAPPSQRSPAPGAAGAALSTTLSWSSSDPDGDALTYDVHLGTSVADGAQRWRKLCPQSAGPGPRAFAATAFDDVGDRLMVFGGESGSTDAADFWIMRTAAVVCDPTAWTPVSAEGGPSGRKRGAAAYDRGPDRFVLQGGCAGGCTTATAETWMLENASGIGGPQTWRALPDAPVALRDQAAAIDDVNHRLIVFGGVPSGSSTPVNDVWILANLGGTGTPGWQPLVIAGPRPDGRAGATASYDSTSNRLILFGGRTAGDAVTSEVWVLTNANGLGGAASWSRLAPGGPAPAARWGHGSGYDRGLRRLITFGGTGAGYDAGTNVVLNDVWALSNADGVSGTAQWKRITAPVPLPPARVGAIAAYSPSQNKLLIRGGKGTTVGPQPPDDSWVLLDAAGSLPLVAQNHTTATFTATALSPDTTYLWRVVARDQHGATAGAAVTPFTTSLPAVSVDDATAVEGAAGTTPMVFSLHLSRPSATDVRVGYTTGDDTAVAGQDFQGADAVVVFPAGTLDAQVTVQILGDAVFEGTESFSLRLHDPQGAVLARTPAVGTILDDDTVPNAAPLVNAGPDQFVAGESTTLVGQVRDDGLPMGAPLTSVWTMVSGPGVVFIADAGAVSTVASFSSPGTYVLRLTASDSALSASDDITISVEVANRGPQVDAGPDQTAPTGTAVSLNGAVSDDGRPQDGILVASWTAVSGPGTVTFGDAGQPRTTVRFSTAGTYVLRLTADDSLLTASDDVSFVVSALNHAPQVTATVTQQPIPTKGRIVVNCDEWTLSNTGFQQGVGVDNFARNLARFFSPNHPGKFLVHTPNFGLNESMLANTMTAAGHTWTINTALPFTLANIQQFDAVFLAADLPANNQVLISYVEAGGSVYIAAGTGAGGALGEAVAWQPLLNHFGIDLETMYRGGGTDAPTIAHPLFVGVGKLLYFGVSSVILFNPLDPYNKVTTGLEGGQPFGRIGIFEVVPDASANLDGTVADDGLPGPALTRTWSQVSGPGQAFFADATAEDTAVRVSVPGTYVLRLSASDGQLTGSVDLTVAIPTVFNHPPVVEAGPDQTVTLPSHDVALAATVQDDDGPASPVVGWEKVSGPGTVTFADRGQASTTATLSASGSYVLRITAGDGRAIASDSLTVTVAPSAGPNTAPLVSAGPDQILERGSNRVENGGGELPMAGTSLPSWVQYIGSWSRGTSSPFEGSGFFEAPGAEMAALRQDIEITPLGSGIDAGTVVLRLRARYRTAAEAVPDQARIRIEYRNATDELMLGSASTGYLASGGGWATVTDARVPPPGTRWIRLYLITQQNTGPTTDVAFDDVSLRTDASGTSLPGTVLDDELPAGAPLTSTWSLASGPGPVSFQSASTPRTGVLFNTAGVYGLRLTASDTDLSRSDDAQVTVNPSNAPPVVAAGPDLLVRLPANTATLTGSAIDDASPAALTTRWIQLTGPGTVVFAAPQAANTTATFPTDGVYTVALTASDGDFTEADSVTVTVLPVPPANDPPRVSAGPDLVARLPLNSVTLQGTVSDDGHPTGATVSSRWTLVAGPGVVSFSSSTQPITDATFSAAGSYLLRLTASDTALSTSDDVVVTVAPTNGANLGPTVSAGPDQLVTQPVTTASLVGAVADDGLPQGGTLTVAWSLVSGPGTASFAQPSATSTSVTLSSVGSYVLRLTATDGTLTSTDDVIVRLTAPNQPPVVSAGVDQVTSAPRPGRAVLSGGAMDDGLPAGVVLSFQWVQVAGPAAATLATPNLATTAVTVTTVGTYTFRLIASDSLSTGFDEVVLTVEAGNQAPLVNAGPDQTIALPTRAVALSGTVSDDGKPAGAALTTRWTAVSGPGAAVFANPLAAATTATFDAPGVYVLRLTAQDTDLPASDNVTVTVTGTATVGAAPTVAISSPADLSNVTAPIDVRGTVTSESLVGWRLEYRDKSLTDEWRTIASGTTPVTDGILGQFDPTLLLNGIYQLRLVATDSSGRVAETPEDEPALNVRGNMKIGQFTLSFLELSVPVSGIPIQLLRNYDSRDPRKGDFGFGWTLQASGIRVSESGKLGRGWTVARQAGFFPVFCAQPTHGKHVTVTISGGKTFEFEATSDDCEFGFQPSLVTVSFKALPGTTATLEPEDGGVALVQEGQLLDANGQPYDPSTYVLTLINGQKFVVSDRTAPDGPGLKSITDLNGNTVTFGPGSISHSAGKSLALNRDDQGRITSIVDPSGNQYVYAYDVDGNLASATDPTGSTTRFTYDTEQPHQLVDVIDARGVRAARNDYDDAGRLISTTDAGGKIVTYQHDVASRREVVVDRTGAQTVLEYDVRGNVTRETDAEGGVTLRTFDLHDNVTSKTDPNGHTWQSEFDPNDFEIKTTDPLGHATSRTYNALGKVLTETDPLGHTTSSGYDLYGNLVATADPLGNTTSYVYSPEGKLRVVIDAAGKTTSYTYDRDGFMTLSRDRLGNVTTYTNDPNGRRLSETRTRTTSAGPESLVTAFVYDGAGRVTQTQQPDGSVLRTTYNPLGLEATRIDALGRTTTLAYDDLGRLASTRFPDATTEETTYDPEGRRATSRDGGGRVTSYSYDRLGRLLKTTFADRAETKTGYDPGGRQTTTTDARANVTSYGYDDAGRRVSTTDPLGNISRLGYDDAGRNTTATDARGFTTTFTYDDAGRRVGSALPDGTQTATGYDQLGQRISETDQAGRITGYGYDEEGRLVRVTDALGHVTSYAYDEVGNRLNQVDANSHETRFEYDKLGRQTARVLPDGKFETKTYDPAGRMLARKDFMGRTTLFQYDDRNRLLTKTYPDGTDVAFTYTLTGHRLTARDARGITSYSYDLRDRPTELMYPDGSKLDYAYDAQGNRTALTVTVGSASLTTSYAYDQRNHVSTITDPDGRLYSYVYNANGRPATLAQPNSVQTSYLYDGMNRLTSLTSRHGSTTLVSYAYSLSPTGLRNAVDEADGTRRAYSYDGIDRLTTETVTGSGPNDYAKTFIYDAVGNRLAQVTAGTNRSVRVDYRYDARDRLLSEDGVVYSWDDNGNLIGNSPAGLYTWDFEDRLTKVTTPDGTTVEHTYDVDGNRVKTTATPTSGTPTIKSYLVDTADELSQVAAEIDGAAAVVAYYVRAADDLLAVRRLSALACYLKDGLGSIRGLADESGAVTDMEAYSAFGESVVVIGTDSQPYGFAGEAVEAISELAYHRARWMDPRTGRFLGMDPSDGDDEVPLTLHRFLYGLADPVNQIDASGKYATSTAEVNGVGIGIAALAFTVGQFVTPRIVPIENAADDSSQPKAHTMIVQVQKRADHYTSKALTLPTSITVTQFSELVDTVSEGARENRDIPSRWKDDMDVEFENVRRWSRARPPLGVSPPAGTKKTVYQRYFGDKNEGRRRFRIDVENPAGRNLMRQ